MGSCLEDRIDTLNRKKEKLENYLRRLGYGIQMELFTFRRIQNNLNFYKDLVTFVKYQETYTKWLLREEKLLLRLSVLYELFDRYQAKFDNLIEEINVQFY